MRFLMLSALLNLVLMTSAKADLQVVIVDEDKMPYELSSKNYDNSPSNYDNSISNYDNSASNYSNSESNYDNSKSNYDNGTSGNRRLISHDRKFIGYYVYSDVGVLNFFNAFGKRIAFMPKNTKNQSVFTGGRWCGAVVSQSGQPVFAMTEQCYYRFLIDQ